MNPLNGIHGNKSIHKILSNALMSPLKALTALMQSGILLGLRSSAKNALASTYCAFGMHICLQNWVLKFYPWF